MSVPSPTLYPSWTLQRRPYLCDTSQHSIRTIDGCFCNIGDSSLRIPVATSIRGRRHFEFRKDLVADYLKLRLEVIERFTGVGRIPPTVEFGLDEFACAIEGTGTAVATSREWVGVLLERCGDSQKGLQEITLLFF